MTSRTILLAIHIASVGAWLGANFVQLALARRFAADTRDADLAWSRQTVWLGERYYPLAGALTAISGVLLVLETDWSWDAGFIWVGVSVVLVGAVLGAAFFSPLAKHRIAALEAGDTARADAAQRRITPLAVLDTALILVAVVAMVHKWQA